MSQSYGTVNDSTATGMCLNAARQNSVALGRRSVGICANLPKFGSPPNRENKAKARYRHADMPSPKTEVKDAQDVNPQLSCDAVPGRNYN